jgi:hypothetical protein
MGSSLSALPLPATPVSQKPSGPRTPAQARKTHLAKDILRALGVSWTTESSKRQRTEDSDPDSSRRGASKKQVIEAGLEDRVQSLSLEVVPAYTPPPQAPPASASYTQSYVASSHSGLVAANNVEDGQVALTDTPSKIATPTIDASINETVPEASESPTAVPLHKPSEDLNAAAKQNGLGL